MYRSDRIADCRETAQLSGIAIGLSVAGAIYVNGAIAGLEVLLPSLSAEDIQLAIAGTSTTFSDSFSPDIRQQATDVIVEAMSKVFILVYVGAAVSLLLSVCFTVCPIYYLPHQRSSLERGQYANSAFLPHRGGCYLKVRLPLRLKYMDRVEVRHLFHINCEEQKDHRWQKVLVVAWDIRQFYRSLRGV